MSKRQEFNMNLCIRKGRWMKMKRHFVTVGFKEYVRKLDITETTYDTLVCSQDLGIPDSIQTSLGRVNLNKSEVLFIELWYQY